MKYINIGLCILFIIIVIIIIYTYTKNKIENFKTITKYNDNVPNETMIKKNIYQKIVNNDKIYNKTITNKELLDTIDKINNNKTSYLTSDDLFNILIILIIDKYPIQNIKSILSYYFGPYVINEKFDFNIKVEYPIDIINRIQWNLYIDYIIKNQLDIHKIINFKNNIKIRGTIENIIPLLRYNKVYDKNIINYADNYNKLMNSDKLTNFIGNSDNKHNYDNNIQNNIIIDEPSIYLDNNKKDKNRLYLDRLNNIIGLYTDNIYQLSNKKKDIDKLKKMDKKNKNMIPYPYDWNYNIINSKNTILDFPYRYQLPLDFNCQRIWQQCKNKDNLQLGYNYYNYHHIGDKYDNDKLKSSKKGSFLNWTSIK